MCNYVLILSIFFLIMRIRNLQCNKCCDCYLWRITQLVKVLQSSLKVPDANTTWLSAECRKPIVARLSLTSVSKLESEGIEWHSLVRLVSRHWPKFGRRTVKNQIKNKLKLNIAVININIINYNPLKNFLLSFTWYVKIVLPGQIYANLLQLGHFPHLPHF